MSDPPPPPEEQSPVAASRTAGDDPGGTVAGEIEKRTIFYCVGIEGHGPDYEEKSMPLFVPFEALTVERDGDNKALLRSNKHRLGPLAERPPIVFDSESDGEWVYTNKKQQIEWTIKEISEKNKFREALETQ